MKPEELRIIVEQAIAGGGNSTWLMVALVSLISAGIGSFFGSYMKKKGENLATKEDFRQLLEQLTEQVSATEQIKADIAASKISTTEQIKQAISNDYWKNQEWIKIRRSKLEDLVSYAFELHQLMDEDSKKLSEDSYKEKDLIFNRAPTQILKIEMLSMLYFKKEIYAESLLLSIRYHEFQKKIIQAFNFHKMNVTKQESSEADKESYMVIENEIYDLAKNFHRAFDEFQLMAEKTLRIIESA